MRSNLPPAVPHTFTLNWDTLADLSMVLLKQGQPQQQALARDTIKDMARKAQLASELLNAIRQARTELKEFGSAANAQATLEQAILRTIN